MRRASSTDPVCECGRARDGRWGCRACDELDAVGQTNRQAVIRAEILHALAGRGMEGATVYDLASAARISIRKILKHLQDLESARRIWIYRTVSDHGSPLVKYALRSLDARTHGFVENERASENW